MTPAAGYRDPAWRWSLEYQEWRICSPWCRAGCWEAAVAGAVLTASDNVRAGAAAGTALVVALVAATLASRWRGVRILRVSRVVADLNRAERFYRDGLGFHPIGAGPGDPALAELLGVPGAIMRQVVLRLGGEEVALVRFDPPGPAYPADSRSNDAWFQHLAIVAGDLDAAFQRVSTQAPQPISTDGPVVLPPRNGWGVGVQVPRPGWASAGADPLSAGHGPDHVTAPRRRRPRN